ncbi:hypothetical protein I6G66_22810 [Delftia acidovorans]|uniref:D-apionate lactonase N-terminal domain-containing protein n=1 Tax=Delftia acidovorans TaxID=80866 RepID=A0A7T2S181_DELAC|nr:hypothetical protein I6G66_22810 [Delftia acidovorans]
MDQWIAETSRVIAGNIAANGPAATTGIAGSVQGWNGHLSSSNRQLQAGPLSAELADGGLRRVRYGGAEILRSLAFVVRDEQADRCVHGNGELSLREESGRFEVSYETAVDCEGLDLAWRVRIVGSARGLDFTAWARARGGVEGGFQHGLHGGRAGLEIVYPRNALAGRSVHVEHVDGSAESTVLPEPDAMLRLSQLSSLTHEPAPGLQVGCRLEGSEFEMVGQRWGGKAFFRLHPRALSPSHSYLLTRGRTLVQMARFSFSVPGSMQ